MYYMDWFDLFIYIKIVQTNKNWLIRFQKFPNVKTQRLDNFSSRGRYSN